jgi:hypothetical protein
MIIALEPTGQLPGGIARSTAARPSTLDGAVVGLVVNGLGESAALLDAVYRELGAMAELGGRVDVLKPSLSTGPTPEDFERLTREATVAICGFGGCGSCSTRALRDAMELEWEGVPSVAVVHRALAPALATMAEMSGMPDYRYVIVDYPHLPIARWELDEVTIIAKQVAPQVLDALVVGGFSAH